MAKQTSKRAPARPAPARRAPAKQSPAPARRAPARRASAPARRAPAPAPAQHFDNELRGALFTNNRKQYEDQPDYTGQSQIAGVEYWVSGWKRKSKAGQTFMSLAFTPKEEQAPQEADGAQYPDDNQVDDLPF